MLFRLTHLELFSSRYDGQGPGSPELDHGRIERDVHVELLLSGTSLDDLSRATGLNRSSIYSSLGDKDSLYLRCLDRYATRYGDRYDQALSGASEEPLRAVRAFFDVTLERIADPGLPDGCLIAQTAMAIPVLSPDIAARAIEALGFQRARLRTALNAAKLSDGDAENFAVHIAAVNQSLAVMSRAGASRGQLRTVIGISMSALSGALHARS